MRKKEFILSYLANRKFVRSSLLVWLVLYLLVVLLQYAGGRDGDYRTIRQISVLTPVVILVFYVNFFLCAFYFLRKKGYYFLYNLLLFVFFLFALYVVLGNASLSITALSLNKLLTAAIYYLILILVSTLYWSTVYASGKTKENLEIALKLQKLEVERNIAEKQFLQSQINPHFLYNTLNFFYAKSLAVSPQLAESVLLLSGIMRYSLEQRENSSGLVFLKDEVEHINNVIKINQYRFTNKLQIQFLISGDASEVRIVPLVLITLVENAFKHGELLDINHPVVITLTVSEARQTILFIVKNKKKTGPKEIGTGIGLENTRRRIALAYAGAEQLVLKDEEEYYTAQLQVPLFKEA